MKKTIRSNVRGKGNENRSQRSQRGQSLVEAAVFVPILVMLLAAAVDFGRIFDAYIVLTNAVREGARFGSVRPEIGEDAVIAIVVADVVGSGTNITEMSDFATKGTVTVDGEEGTSTKVTVTASYPFHLWFGGIVGISQVTLTKTADMPRWRANGN